MLLKKLEILILSKFLLSGSFLQKKLNGSLNYLYSNKFSGYVYKNI